VINVIFSNNRLTRGAAIGAGWFAAMAAVWPAQAAWEIVPELGLTTEVDDNARIVPQDQESSSRTALDARLRLRSFGTRGEAFIEPRIVTDAYGDSRDEELESDDVFLLTRAEYAFRSTTLELQTDYRRESVLRSELDDAIGDDPDLGGAPIDTGAGTFGTFSDERERFDFGLNVGFALSERTNLRLETSRIDVAYPDATSAVRSPFDNNTFAAVLTRLADRRNQVSARMYVSDFHADRNDNNTDAFGVQGSFVRPLSETWTFNLDAGIVRTDYAFVNALGEPVDNADSSFTFGTNFEKRSELTTWSIGFTRAINPNSNGFLSLRDDVRVRASRQFRPRLSAAFGIRAAEIDAFIAGAGEERDYWRASLEVQWAMTPRWRLLTGIDRVTQEFLTAGSADATSNSVFVGVRYQGLSQQR
jgi:hypothetical protein